MAVIAMVMAVSGVAGTTLDADANDAEKKMETPAVIHTLHYEEPVHLLSHERAEHKDGFSLTVNGYGHRRAKDGDFTFVAVRVQHEQDSGEFLIYLQRPARDSRVWKEWTITVLDHDVMPPPDPADTKTTFLITRNQ